MWHVCHHRQEGIERREREDRGGESTSLGGRAFHYRPTNASAVPYFLERGHTPIFQIGVTTVREEGGLKSFFFSESSDTCWEYGRVSSLVEVWLVFVLVSISSPALPAAAAVLAFFAA